MSFNIAGIALNKKIDNTAENLKDLLGFNIAFEEEIDFETASENWKEEGIIDLVPLDNTSIIFTDMDIAMGSYKLTDTVVLTFAISETSDAYNLVLNNGHTTLRNIMEVQGERLTNEGEPLLFENEAESINTLIFKSLEHVLGQSYFSIQPDNKAFRFTID
jgi:hypothetical protein